MSYRVPNPPPKSLAAARAGVRALAAQGRVQAPQAPKAAPALRADQLTVTHPVQVYTLGLDDLRAGRTLANAHAVAWRYLVQHGGSDVALAETIIRKGGDHVFSMLNYGPFVSGMSAAMRAAENAPGAAQSELRLLFVPALHLFAVWLRNDAGHDVLVPLHPAPKGITGNHGYPGGELVAELAERARALPNRPPHDSIG